MRQTKAIIPDVFLDFVQSPKIHSQMVQLLSVIHNVREWSLFLPMMLIVSTAIPCNSGELQREFKFGNLAKLRQNTKIKTANINFSDYVTIRNSINANLKTRQLCF